MRRLLFILGILAGLALALYAGWRVERWRDLESDKRLGTGSLPPGRGLALSDCRLPDLGEQRRLGRVVHERWDRRCAGGERLSGL